MRTDNVRPTDFAQGFNAPAAVRSGHETIYAAGIGLGQARCLTLAVTVLEPIAAMRNEVRRKAFYLTQGSHGFPPSGRPVASRFARGGSSMPFAVSFFGCCPIVFGQGKVNKARFIGRGFLGHLPLLGFPPSVILGRVFVGAHTPPPSGSITHPKRRASYLQLAADDAASPLH